MPTCPVSAWANIPQRWVSRAKRAGPSSGRPSRRRSRRSWPRAYRASTKKPSCPSSATVAWKTCTGRMDIRPSSTSTIASSARSCSATETTARVLSETPPALLAPARRNDCKMHRHERRHADVADGREAGVARHPHRAIRAECGTDGAAPDSFVASDAGTFVFGLSPRLPFDEAYRGFLGDFVSVVAAALARLAIVETGARVEAEQARSRRDARAIDCRTRRARGSTRGREPHEGCLSRHRVARAAYSALGHPRAGLACCQRGHVPAEKVPHALDVIERKRPRAGPVDRRRPRHDPRHGRHPAARHRVAHARAAARGRGRFGAECNGPEKIAFSCQLGDAASHWSATRAASGRFCRACSANALKFTRAAAPSTWPCSASARASRSPSSLRAGVSPPSCSPRSSEHFGQADAGSARAHGG